MALVFFSKSVLLINTITHCFSAPIFAISFVMILPLKITEEGAILAMIQECYKRRAADALAYDDMQTENQLANVKLFIKIIRKQHKYSGNFLTHLFGQ